MAMYHKRDPKLKKCFIIREYVTWQIEPHTPIHMRLFLNVKQDDIRFHGALNGEEDLNFQQKLSVKDNLTGKQVRIHEPSTIPRPVLEGRVSPARAGRLRAALSTARPCDR